MSVAPSYADKLREEIAAETRPARRKFLETHLATYERISERVRLNGEEEREARQALAWCRANGNPHLPALITLPVEN